MPSATYTDHEFKEPSDVLNDIAMNLTKEPICAFTRDAKNRLDTRQIYFGHSSVPEPFIPTADVEGDPSPLTQPVTDLSLITSSQKDLLDRLMNRNEHVVIKFGNFSTYMFRVYSYVDQVFRVLNVELVTF